MIDDFGGEKYLNMSVSALDNANKGRTCLQTVNDRPLAGEFGMLSQAAIINRENEDDIEHNGEDLDFRQRTTRTRR